MNKKENRDESMTAPVSPVVERNIRSLVNRQIQEERKKSVQERIAESIGRFTGNITFAYMHAIIFGVWIMWNLGWLELKPFDPSFTGLQITASIEAILLTTFVLMNQTSLDAQADKRAELDLQISLLSEHEITRLIGLVRGIAKKLEVDEAKDPEINELSEEVKPDTLMDTLENEKQKSRKEAHIKDKF